MYKKGDKFILEIKEVIFGNGSTFYLDANRDIILDKTLDKLVKVEEKSTEEEVLYNGKIVCMKDSFPMTTLGRVYNVVQGRFVLDNGIRTTCFRNFNEINSSLDLSFAEYKEPVGTGYTNTVVCIEAHGDFELGKAYKVIDGFLLWLKYSGPFNSLEELNEYFHSKFVQVTD